jgi:hypothetical protein
MRKLTVVMMLSLLVVPLASRAEEWSTNKTSRKTFDPAVKGTSFVIMSPTLLSQLSLGKKDVVMGARVDAVQVLKQEPATDAFNEARDVLVELGAEFASDQEAAGAILVLAEAIEAGQGGEMRLVRP